MKKVLIVTYCYPPCNAISAHRPKSFADNFPKYGLYPIVVSRHWKGDEKTWLDFQKPDLRPPLVETGQEATVIQLPYEGRRLRQFEKFKSFAPARKLAAFFLSATGQFQIHNNAIESYENFLNKYLKENPVDCIFATCDPLSIVRLGSRLSKRFKVPLIVDFRDLWNNNILSTEYRPTTGERIVDFFYEFYIARWIRRASFVTAVTSPINDEVRRISPGMRTVTVMNGFETKLLESSSETVAKPNDKFTFSLIGTLHADHDFSLFLDGMDLFLKDRDLSEIQLNLIGTGGIPEIRRIFEDRFPAECTRITDRIPRNEAIAIMNSSDVLFHAGWRSFRGIASGKVFEYMAARRNVLIAPGDKDIMEELVTSTRIGKVANSPEEFAAALDGWYAEWLENGKLEWHGDISAIMNYSRENQARILAEEILKIDSE